MKIIDFLGTDLEYDNENQHIWGRRNGGIYLLGVLKTLHSIEEGFISGVKLSQKGKQEASDFQQELGKWIIDAINEKIEREKIIENG